METKFNSQICTTREQSERLLTLGLKKETADMNYTRLSRGDSWTLFIGKPLGYEDIPTEYLIPAWSLNRLIELIKTSEFKVLNSYKYGEATKSFILRMIIHSDDIYEGIVEAMEILIEKYHFLNKEYLV